MDIKKIDIRKCNWQVMINPNALSGKSVKHWQKLSEMLGKAGIPYQEHYVSQPSVGRSMTERLCRSGERYFIIFGGDGTINEIINGVASSGIETQEAFIVPFPIGTGNDWAHTHRYPKDFLQLLPSFIEGHFKTHDIGLVKTIQNGQVVDSRYFINIAGFCFDAEVINETTKGKDPLFASATYIWSLIKILFRYKSRTVRVKAGSVNVEKPFFTIAVGIGKYNGNGMMQVPMADPFDGLFDVVLIERISVLKAIANVGNLFSGKHIALKEVSVIQCKELEINANPFVMGEAEGGNACHGKLSGYNPAGSSSHLDYS